MTDRRISMYVSRGHDFHRVSDRNSLRPKWLSYGVALIHFVHVLIPASNGHDSGQAASHSCIESEEMWEDEEGDYK